MHASQRPVQMCIISLIAGKLKERREERKGGREGGRKGGRKEGFVIK